MRIKIKNSKFALLVMGRAGRFAAIASYRSHAYHHVLSIEIEATVKTPAACSAK
jgi:hypothetical protein